MPLVADTSSDMFSRPIDVTKYGLIYAGAQKNLGPVGRRAGHHPGRPGRGRPEDLPTMLQYRTHAAEKSLYNTPPTFGIYVMGEVFKWIKGQGGLAAMAEHNEAKARLLYDFIDQSDFFRGTGAARQPLADERLLPGPDRGAGEQVHRRGDQAGARRAQGPPLGRRHAREHLQRLPAGRRSRRWSRS